MPYAPVNGIQLYYDEYGRGAPLVLIHGFSWTGQVWGGLVPALAVERRVIVPDLRGHGRSGGEPATMRHRYFAADLVGLLDYLGLERADFVGHSTGGMALLYVGTRHLARARTLALVSAAPTYDATAKQEMLRTVEEMPNRPKVIATLRRLHGATRGDDCWRIYRDVFRAFAEDPSELAFGPADLAAITCPVLVLHGDRDAYFPVTVPLALYRALPNAELGIFPATGHFLPKDSPELFLQAVLGFYRLQQNV